MEKALQLNDLEGQVMEGKRIIKFPRDQQKSQTLHVKDVSNKDIFPCDSVVSCSLVPPPIDPNK